jgi:hypothetical protein
MNVNIKNFLKNVKNKYCNLKDAILNLQWCNFITSENSVNPRNQEKLKGVEILGDFSQHMEQYTEERAGE